MSNEPIYHVMDIIRGTTVDGPGFRTSIYLAGCTHGCPGCHNPQSHSFDAGQPMTLGEIIDIVREEEFNVTLSGGDPLCSPKATATLAAEIRKLGLSVWLYTGYTWESFLESDLLREAVADVDVVVEGPFIRALRDTDLLFRGSSNQRIVDVKASLASGKTVLFAS